eukprot:5302067-Pyramimonas_sp.AAC.2
MPRARPSHSDLPMGMVLLGRLSGLVVAILLGLGVGNRSLLCRCRLRGVGRRLGPGAGGCLDGWRLGAVALVDCTGCPVGESCREDFVPHACNLEVRSARLTQQFRPERRPSVAVQHAVRLRDGAGVRHQDIHAYILHEHEVGHGAQHLEHVGSSHGQEAREIDISVEDSQGHVGWSRTGLPNHFAA